MKHNNEPYSVLFVCTGNICRSPTAEAIFRHISSIKLWQRPLICDSAGMHGYHSGESPDPRSIKTAAKHGISMSDLRARQLINEDFYLFDHIVAMDRGHISSLIAIKPENAKAQLSLLLDAMPEMVGQDVPDPYYGSLSDFEMVYKLIEKGIEAFYQKITDNSL